MRAFLYACYSTLSDVLEKEVWPPYCCRPVKDILAFILYLGMIPVGLFLQKAVPQGFANIVMAIGVDEVVMAVSVTGIVLLGLFVAFLLVAEWHEKDPSMYILIVLFGLVFAGALLGYS